MPRAILVSDRLVPEIISGRKTATRRLNKLDYVNRDPDNFILEAVKNDPTLGWIAKFTSHASGFKTCVRSPYGGTRDTIWVRENWYVGKEFDGVKPISLPAPHNVGAHLGFIADGPKPDWAGVTRASIHLRRDYSRLELEITSLAIQRLHAITEAEAEAEGVPRGIFRDGPGTEEGEFHLELNIHGTLRDGFKWTWFTLNGRESWELNPWVWVVSFTLLNVKR